MPKLIGFEPSIKLEMQFTGLELLHLLHGANMHYDGACKAAAYHAGKDGRLNGLLVTTMMRMDEFDWSGNGVSDEAFLIQHPNATADVSLTARELGLLTKISEQFNLIATMKVPPQHFSKDVAVGIMFGLRKADNEACLQLDILREQEALRRERFDAAEKNILSTNAN
jgi:hypothetical protein